MGIVGGPSGEGGFLGKIHYSVNQGKKEPAHGSRMERPFTTEQRRPTQRKGLSGKAAVGDGAGGGANGGARRGCQKALLA